MKAYHNLLISLVFLIGSIFSQRFLDDSLSGNDCFSVATATQPSSNSTSSQKAKYAVAIQNSCSSAQPIQNLEIDINNWQVNGAAVVDKVEFHQGQNNNPWIRDVAPTFSNGNIALLINTPHCQGNSCGWAQVAAGKSLTFIISHNAGAAIVSSAVDSVTLNPDPVIKASDAPSSAASASNSTNSTSHAKHDHKPKLGNGNSSGSSTNSTDGSILSATGRKKKGQGNAKAANSTRKGKSNDKTKKNKGPKAANAAQPSSSASQPAAQPATSPLQPSGLAANSSNSTNSTQAGAQISAGNPQGKIINPRH